MAYIAEKSSQKTEDAARPLKSNQKTGYGLHRTDTVLYLCRRINQGRPLDNLAYSLGN